MDRSIGPGLGFYKPRSCRSKSARSCSQSTGPMAGELVLRPTIEKAHCYPRYLDKYPDTSGEPPHACSQSTRDFIEGFRDAYTPSYVYRHFRAQPHLLDMATANLPAAAKAHMTCSTPSRRWLGKWASRLGQDLDACKCILPGKAVFYRALMG